MSARLGRLFQLDLRALAVFRIAMGSVIALDLILRACWFEAFFTESGLLPLAVLKKFVWHDFSWSFHTLSPEPWWAALLLILHGLFALLFILGLQTRLITPLLWVFSISLEARFPYSANAGDHILRMALFWGMFLPLGARWSLDARRRVQRAESPQAALPVSLRSVGAAGFTLQLIYIYVATAILKWHPVWWPSGDALAMSLHADAYTTTLGQSLSGLGARWPLPLRMLTWGTIIWEYVGPLLVLASFSLPRLRLAAILGFLALHVGIASTLRIGIFPFVCMVYWLAFLPAELFDKWLPRLLARRARGTRVKTADSLPAAPLRARLLTNLLAAGLLALVTLLVVEICDARTNHLRLRGAIPQKLHEAQLLLRLDQNWAMFAPTPPDTDGWYVCKTLFADGSEGDICRDGAPLEWRKPALASATYPSQRWRKYQLVLPYLPHALRRSFQDWLRKDWEAKHPQRKIEYLRTVYRRRVFSAAGENPPTSLLVWHQRYIFRNKNKR